MTLSTPKTKLHWTGERKGGAVVYRSVVWSGLNDNWNQVRDEFIVEASGQGNSWKANFISRQHIITFLGYQSESAAAKVLCEEYLTAHPISQ